MLRIESKASLYAKQGNVPLSHAPSPLLGWGGVRVEILGKGSTTEPRPSLSLGDSSKSSITEPSCPRLFLFCSFALFYFIYMNVLPACTCAMCMPFASYHVGAGNRTQVLCKRGNKCS